MDVEPTDMAGQLCLFLDKWQVKQNGFFDWLRPIMICPLAAGHFAAWKKKIRLLSPKKKREFALGWEAIATNREKSYFL